MVHLSVLHALKMAATNRLQTPNFWLSGAQFNSSINWNSFTTLQHFASMPSPNKHQLVYWFTTNKHSHSKVHLPDLQPVYLFIHTNWAFLISSISSILHFDGRFFFLFFSSLFSSLFIWFCFVYDYGLTVHTIPHWLTLTLTLSLDVWLFGNIFTITHRKQIKSKHSEI